MKYFVDTFEILYGKEFISYNVHGLLHIADDARHFGSLDTFSAFRFENHLGKLIKLLKNPNHSVAQLHHRLFERMFLGLKKRDSVSGDKFKRHHSDGPLLQGTHSPQFRSCTINNFCLKVGERDGTVLLNDGKIVVVRNFATNQAGDVAIIGSTFKTQTNLYTLPNDSKHLGVFDSM